MASKKQIAEQALLILSGGHLKPDRTIDIREVMLNLDQVRDELVRESTKANIAYGIYAVNDDYLTFYESVSVSTDGVGSLSYITLPVNIISLPLGMGLYQITPTTDLENQFIITKAGAIGQFAGTQALDRSLDTYCWKVGERVYFKNLPDGTTVVTVLLAASSKDIADTADYPVSPDEEDVLLKKLLATFGVEIQIPHDEAEDGQK